MNFKEAAILSSKQYYNYLDKHKGSLIEYKVSEITYDNIYFYIKAFQRLYSLEYLQVMINADIYNENQIKIVRYDKEENILTIATDETIKKYLQSAKPQEVLLISDMKFLVKSVESFYKTFGHLLTLPTYINNDTYVEDNRLSSHPSDEQLCTINGILQNPLSYVWGAPGTGKTKFVLARCVLSLLKSKSSKILITAPTNNAVEQTLYGVLPILKQCGIDLKKVLRLGTPSAEFAQKYSMCCEHLDIEHLVRELTEEIASLEKQINKNKSIISLFPEYKAYLKFEANFTSCETQIPRLLEKLHDIYTKISSTKQALSIAQGKIANANSKITELNRNRKTISNKIVLLTTQVNRYSKGWRFKLLHKKFLHCSVELDNNLNMLSDVEEKIKENNDIISDCNKQSISLNNAELEFLSLKDKIISQICNLTAFWDKLYIHCEYLEPEVFENTCKDLSSALVSGRESLNQRAERYKDLVGNQEISFCKDLISLNHRKGLLQQQLDNISHLSSSERVKSCQVIAATVDTCIRRVLPNDSFMPTHIFLDEAGYCPLIKGVALLTYHCPITLLGDHMQLPPICEMNDEQLQGDNRVVALWSQSALFLDSFDNDIETIILDYLTHEEPTFKNTAYFALNHTFRFGERLANVLADYVYTPSFHGNESVDTNIYFINSPKSKYDEGRRSQTELTNILNYVEKHTEENIGIVTPYKSQKELLIKAFNEKSINKKVYTVHGSQGREWDTVMISVVDTTNKWFTNSLLQKSNGKNVINTAISRAKKKLIIVCDVDYWQTQHKQLIGRLLEIAEEITF